MLKNGQKLSEMFGNSLTYANYGRKLWKNSFKNVKNEKVKSGKKWVKKSSDMVKYSQK